MTAELPILIFGFIVGFYMAWNIGANDVANAMASSVGAKAITLRQAVLIAGILNMLFFDKPIFTRTFVNIPNLLPILFRLSFIAKIKLFIYVSSC